MPFLVPFAGLVATLPVQRPDADPKPHIIFFLQDDLGRYNVAFNADRTDMPSVDVASVSPQISMLAKQGIILDRHYVHWHCSPTRRSLLTGRTPLHHGEALSGITTDDIDLRWSTIGQKLEGVGYKSHWYGKGHTGYKSMNHLPDRIGFSSGHLGFLSGAMNYHGEQRWRDEQPYHTAEYSTKLYGDAAVAALEAHDPNAAPLFMYLPWQAVHEPYTAPPGYNASAQSCDGAGAHACVLYAMLGVADTYVGRITTLLRSKGMWDSTLVVYSADNGGVSAGVNYPLRGEKHTNWEGGMRVAAFVSGGFVPAALRGTSRDLIVHISDWYPTLCRLAGADPTDDPPVPPLPVDPSHPNKDIYGEHSYPPVDGVDVWPHLTAASPPNATAAHAQLWLSREVMLVGVHKIVVAQPDPSMMSAKTINNGWKLPNGTWVGNDEQYGCNAYHQRSRFRPCVFDVVSDAREERDLSTAQPDLLASLWAQLNTTELSAYTARTPSRLLGPCHAKCAAKHWRQLGAFVEEAEDVAGALGGDDDGRFNSTEEDGAGSAGPICDVPGCKGDQSVA